MFGQRPKRCACLVLRTSVGFENLTYRLPVCILFFEWVWDKQSAALHWAPAYAGATDIWFCKSLRPSEKFSDGLYVLYGFVLCIYSGMNEKLIQPSKSQPVGRILESDTCSQNKARTSLWPMAKRRIQESDLRRWCCRTAFYFVRLFFWIGINRLALIFWCAISIQK